MCQPHTHSNVSCMLNCCKKEWLRSKSSFSYWPSGTALHFQGLSGPRWKHVICFIQSMKFKSLYIQIHLPMMSLHMLEVNKFPIHCKKKKKKQWLGFYSQLYTFYYDFNKIQNPYKKCLINLYSHHLTADIDIMEIIFCQSLHCHVKCLQGRKHLGCDLSFLINKEQRETKYIHFEGV